MIRRRKSASGGLFVIAIVVATAVPGASPAAADVTVQSVLQSLQSTGLEVIYSSDLVPPELAAPAPREGATLLQRAAQALAPYGLALRPIGAKTFVVVKVDAVQVAAIVARPDPVLEEVTVYASRYAMVGRGRYDEKVMDSATIQSVPGSHDDPLRALRSLPGLAATVSARPYIRGSLSNDVLVRYDGVTLLDPYHLKNFQSLYGAIDPLAVGSMEVYSSGYPVRYGTRSGGVIDIAPPTRPQGNDFSLSLSKLSMGAAVSGKSDRWPVEWLATVRRNTTDLVLAPFDAEQEVPSVFDTTGLLHWSVGDRSDIHVGWLLLDDRVEAGQATDGGSAQASYRDEYVWLAYRYRFENHWQSRTTVSNTAAERTRQGEVQLPSVSSGQLAESRRYHKTEIASDWSFDPGTGLSATVGAAMATTDSKYRYSRELRLEPAVAAAFGRPASGDLTGSAAPNAKTFSAYGALRRSWSSIEAELGLRLDGQDFRGDSSQWQWSPRANLRYDLSDRWRAYGSIGRFTQAQAVEEWRAEELQQRADPAQSAVHSVAGLAYDRGMGTRWSLEIYRKRWTKVSPYFESQLDPLALLPDLLPDRVRIAPDHSEASGIELSVRKRLAGGLHGWAGVTAARVADEFNEADQSRSWDQPLALNAGVAWAGLRTEFSVMAGWHTGWPHTPVAATGETVAGPVAIGPRNSERWNDYLTFDVRGSWTRPSLGGELTAFVEITNASNQRNPCCTVLQPATSGAPVFQIEKAYWLPLVLNLGVTIHWRTKP